MESIENRLRGFVRVEVVGLDVERFLNLCAQNGLEFWDLRRTPEGAFQMNFTLKNWRAAQHLVRRAMCEAKVIRSRGMPVLFRRVKARFVLLAGFLLCLFGLAALSMFIWEIDIVGESVVPDAVILSALEEAGVGMGTFGLSVDSELLRSRLLLELPELKWISINVFGSRAVVSVRDRTAPPEIVDMETPGDIVAASPGLIESILVYEGQALVEKGSTVLAGEPLVSGSLGSLSGTDRTVHALADVYARTWYSLSAQMPLEAMAKAYTGEDFTRRALYVGGRRLNLYLEGGIPLDGYDKITERKSLALSGGFTFPVSLVTETYRPYETHVVELSRAEAEEILKAGLAQDLMEKLGDGEVLDYSFETVEADGLITVTLRAECLENIAIEAPLSGVREEIELD